MKKLFVISALLLIGTFTNAQINTLPNIEAGGGMLSFNGDISKSFYNKISGGYFLSIEQKFHPYISLSLTGLYGKLFDRDIESTKHLNFQSKIIQGDLSLILHLDKPSTPFVSFGFGYLKFDPHGDLTDIYGSKYYYWNDGSIKDIPEDSPTSASAKNLVRDYTYETQLTDSLENYKRNTFVVPLSIGYRISLLDQFSIKAAITYGLCFTDWIDNVKAGGNDSYYLGSLSFVFHLSKPPIEKNEVFNKIDKDDRDGDGVKDIDDECPSTPFNVKTDEKGCPLDTDNDGVADYLDKEPNSPPGLAVDNQGIAQTDKVIAKKKKEMDDLAAGKTKEYSDQKKEASSTPTVIIKSTTTTATDTVKKDILNTTPSETPTSKATNSSNNAKPTNTEVKKETKDLEVKAPTETKTEAAKPVKTTTTSIKKAEATPKTTSTPPVKQTETAEKIKPVAQIKSTLPESLKGFDINNDGELSSEELIKALETLKAYIKEQEKK